MCIIEYRVHTQQITEYSHKELLGIYTKITEYICKRLLSTQKESTKNQYIPQQYIPHTVHNIPLPYE